MQQLIKNQRYTEDYHAPFQIQNDAINLHRKIVEYRETPVYHFPGLAGKYGVKAIYVKDESKRFTLDTFKALGPIYALYKFFNKLQLESYSRKLDYHDFLDPDYLKKMGDFVFTTATDGNHGKSLAWACDLIGQKSVIYVPDYTVKARLDAISRFKTEVIKINGTYQDAVNKCYEDARRKNRVVITDTSWETNTESALSIMEAYLTLFNEIDSWQDRMGIEKLDYFLLQCGVGSLTACGLYHYKNKGLQYPRIINVEPYESDCVYQSIKNDKISKAKGSLKTIMAGLNCDIPSELAWQIFRTNLEYSMLIDDNSVKNALRFLYQPDYRDPRIESAESGAASFAATLEILGNRELRQELGVNENSQFMMINTEANTDPENIERILNGR